MTKAECIYPIQLDFNDTIDTKLYVKRDDVSILIVNFGFYVVTFKQLACPIMIYLIGILLLTIKL